MKKDRIHLNTFLLLLILSSLTKAQIPINGFCELSEFIVKPNLNNLLAVDYNSDGYRDLVLFNPSINTYQTISSSSRNSFSSPQEKYSPLKISSLQPYSLEYSAKKYVALSRGTKEAAIVTFSKSGYISVVNRLKFPGFPSTSSIGDIDSDNIPEIVLAGVSLDGLRVVSTKKGLKETENIKGKIFSSAFLIDLNYDSYTDIAAFDISSNSLIFLTNNSLGEFSEVRSIGFTGEVKELRALDVNSNGFNDFVYIQDGKLEVIWGDSLSTFQNRTTIDLPIAISNYSIFDYNGDGYNDFAFISQDKHDLYISFAKSTSSLHSSIKYLSSSNLVAINSFVDRSGKKMAALSSDGKVFVISSFLLPDDSYSIAIGQKVTALQDFDYGNDGYKDLCFVDNGKYTFNILLSERRNLYRSYYSIKIGDSYSKIEVDESKPYLKTFFCYTKGGKAIEIIKVNFELNKTEQQIVYTDDTIEDIQIAEDRLNDKNSIIAITKQKNNLSIQQFDLYTKKYVKKTKQLISSNVEGASIALGVNKNILALFKQNNSVDIIDIMYERRILTTNPRLTFEVGANDNLKFQLLYIGDLFAKTRPAISLLSINKKNSLYLFTHSKNYRYSLKGEFSLSNKVQYIIEDDDKISFFFNNEIKNRIVKVDFSWSKKSFTEKEIFESKGMNNYLVTKLDKQSMFVVTSNNSHGYISIKKI